MRLILTWRQWALLDFEFLLLQRIGEDGDTELDDADPDVVAFGFGIRED